MIRVLHLRPLESDYQTDSCIAALAADTSGRTEAMIHTIGRGGTYSTPVAAVIGLRRGKLSCDLIHAWGMRPLSIAAVGTRAALPILFSPIEYPPLRQIRWLLSVMSYRQVHVVCPTDTMRRRFVENGVPIAACHLIRPGISFARIRRRRDPALRQALGIAPDDRVMLAPGETTRAAGHADALFAATVLN